MGGLYRREYHRSILCSLLCSCSFLRIVWRYFKKCIGSISSIISAAGLRKNKAKTITNMAVEAVQFACKLLSVYLRPFCNFDLYVGTEAWKLINVGFPHCKTNSELGNQRAKLNALHFAET